MSEVARSSGRGRATRRSAVETATSGAQERIRLAAIELFKSRGYHGTSVRDLAQATGLEPASLYYHFASKQEILLDLVDRVMDAMLDGLDKILASRSRPSERLEAAVRFHVLYHVAHQDEAFVSHAELRSLTPQNRNAVFAKRDKYERMFRDLIAAGVAADEFAVEDVPLTCISVLMMCSGVSDWFTRGGRLTAVGVADRYVDMVMRLVRPSAPIST